MRAGPAPEKSRSCTPLDPGTSFSVSDEVKSNYYAGAILFIKYQNLKHVHTSLFYVRVLSVMSYLFINELNGYKHETYKPTPRKMFC